ncbi:hypothetical protein WG66_005446 [Moniliophthora roreri]|nr:hypothetical protein WG66_005446 [Moniliophthora roreri]
MRLTFKTTSKRVDQWKSIHLEVEEVLSYDHDDEAERRDNEKKMDPYVTFNDRNKNVLCAPLIPDLNHLSESPLR